MRIGMLLLFVGCFAGPVFALEPQGDQASPKEPPQAKQAESIWMRKKLEYSQAILRGMALGDFAAIKASANQIQVLNKVEGFVRRRNPKYTRYVREFTAISSDIVENAEAENLAGVTLSFNQLTVNCVNCHRSLRAPRRGDHGEAP